MIVIAFIVTVLLRKKKKDKFSTPLAILLSKVVEITNCFLEPRDFFIGTYPPESLLRTNDDQVAYNTDRFSLVL